MPLLKETVLDLKEKYNKVLKLMLDDGNSESEPYSSKYAAREILLDMQNTVENLYKSENLDSDDELKLIAMLGTIQLYLGMVCIDTEELSTGEIHLEKCKETIQDHVEKPEVIMVALNMYNQFGILWSQREPEKSKLYLEKSEELYKNYKRHPLPPVDIADLFNVDEPADVEMAGINFEKLYTFTLYYLAQIYRALEDAMKSSLYCHVTLQRQLDSKDYHPIDWALNAATLSQFFMERNGFKQARHHLAASSYIIDKYADELSSVEVTTEEHEAKLEVLKHRSADVARCWAKYGLLLLSKSKERLLNRPDEVDSTISDLEKLRLNSTDLTLITEGVPNLEFTSLDLSKYEMEVTCKFVLTIQDARLVFVNIQKWLGKAKLYYTLENLASDHVEIIQDESQMYLNLLFFDESVENQAKLHKRRIDLLENVISKINPQYYLPYCRQIWYELAQVYSDILNIKADRMRDSNERPTPQALTKINYLIDQSIYHFNCFIESFKDANSGEIPSKIPDDFEQPFLQAYFYIAALNSRYITMDKNAQLIRTEKSYECYKKVNDYCKIDNKAKEKIPMEISICEEMVQLLPVKIAKLKQEIS